MNGILYTILVVVVFMIAAAIFGSLLGRSGRRRAAAADPEFEYRLTIAHDAIRELEEEREALEAALGAAKKEAVLAREEAAEAERSAAVRFQRPPADETEAMTELRAKLEKANENAARLEAEVKRRNRRISQLESTRTEPGGTPVPGTPPVSGFSTSAGAFADTRIVFSEDEPDR